MVCVCQVRNCLLRAFPSLAPLLAAALAFGIQVADPLRDGRLPRLLRRWLVLQQATRLEAELLRHANISGRKPAASRDFRPCLVQRYPLRHRRARAARTLENAVGNLWGTVDGLGARATWY